MIGSRNLCRLPMGSSVWKRRMPWNSSSNAVGYPAVFSVAGYLSSPVTSNPGCALRAGWKSCSTPRWSSKPNPLNQQPPRATRARGFGTPQTRELQRTTPDVLFPIPEGRPTEHGESRMECPFLLWRFEERLQVNLPCRLNERNHKLDPGFLRRQVLCRDDADPDEIETAA